MSNINGKPVVELPAKGVLNLKSGFLHKQLCDGPTFSAGTACAYSCSFCYVPALMQKDVRVGAVMAETGASFDGLVIRRRGAVQTLRSQLTGRKGERRYNDPNDTRVVFASPLVDIAPNMELARETAEMCLVILEMTNWQIRLLSKSPLIVKIAEIIPEKYWPRLIMGLSTGTTDEALAKAFEGGTPLPSKRVAALHKMQDMGLRTFGMVCPSLPVDDYLAFSQDAMSAIRIDKCEHVWGEVINVRGESMTRTVDALVAGGFSDTAEAVRTVSTNREAWEQYARDTYLAHAQTCPPEKLRFLQYVTNANRDWWAGKPGAVLL